jgi:hypothetical protein
MEGSADLPDLVLEFRDLLATAWITHAIHAAASLGIADVVAEGPRTCDDIAATVTADAVSVDRLLRGLVTLGLFEQTHDGGYALTPMGGLLRSGTPESQRGRVLLQFGAPSLRSWGAFNECIRTGQTASKLLDGVDDPFAFFLNNPEAGAQFDGAMAEGTKQLADRIAATYDYSGVARIIDVGGGYGALLPPILRAHPEMTGVVFDRPHCRNGAEQLVRQAGLSDRYAFVSGDFFVDPLPTGADAYVLKSVLHDWDDDRAGAILRRCHDAMHDKSRLLIVEVVVPDRLDNTAEHRGLVYADLHMLVATGGRERTEAQYRRLLDEAGLDLTHIVSTDTPAGLDIIEARPCPPN